LEKDDSTRENLPIANERYFAHINHILSIFSGAFLLPMCFFCAQTTLLALGNVLRIINHQRLASTAAKESDVMAVMIDSVFLGTFAAPSFVSNSKQAAECVVASKQAATRTRAHVSQPVSQYVEVKHANEATKRTESPAQ